MDTIFDFMCTFEDFLTILNRHGIRMSDVRYFPAYRDYLRMRSEGMTYYAAVETASERHGMPVGTLRRIFRRFSQRITK